LYNKEGEWDIPTVMRETTKKTPEGCSVAKREAVRAYLVLPWHPQGLRRLC
jgi:hypothetical protein